MVIGITGGVGAGKSTVLEILETEYGAFLIIADEIAKQLMEPGGASYEAVCRAFGEEILEKEDAQGNRPIDRAKLAAIVFDDDEKLALLNALTHQLVRIRIEEMIREKQETDADALIVIEAALLIECGYRDILDALWVVDADPEVRIRRLMESRGYSREKCEDMMDNQLSREAFAKEADELIDNSGTIEEVREKIAEVFRKIRKETDRPAPGETH